MSNEIKSADAIEEGRNKEQTKTSQVSFRDPNENKDHGFNNKIKSIGLGLSSTNDDRIEKKFESQSKDIVHDNIYELNVKTPEDYKKINEARIEEKNRKLRDSYSYSNVSDARFNHSENLLFGKDQKQKADYFKKKGASYYGANASRRGFSRRLRRVLQLGGEGVQQKAQEKFEKLRMVDTIKGFHDTTNDYKEIMEEGRYILRNYDDSRERNRPRQSHGINFEKIVEQDVRNNFGLMAGRQNSDVSKYVTEYKKSYLENNAHNAGGSKEVAGRFQGGFERRNMLNQAQNRQNKQPEYEYNISSSNRVNLEAVYFDYGNKNKADDVLIDEDQETEDAGKLAIQL